MKRLLSIGALIIAVSCGVRLSKTVETASGLKYTIIKKGNGKPAKVGDEVLIFETTSYRDGTVLYSNENSGKPVKVKIGANQATQAVDEGLRGMRTGEIRVLQASANLVKRTGYPANVSKDSALVIRMKLGKILTD
ncbi:FKBP-type peptidyl-prolyl cis-trans isomerase [Flavobacterium sp.]|uniref:FKBP-type peptidyl-prolyl cis-trans isomerase n=1 Tax=Flavobacterium sp. TaxID=239 RepID=UPI0025B91D76|nr:FKBP-type peptidyl-prolyl cis-trans isomerase [Flavobacterium sp.]